MIDSSHQHPVLHPPEPVSNPSHAFGPPNQVSCPSHIPTPHVSATSKPPAPLFDPRSCIWTHKDLFGPTKTRFRASATRLEPPPPISSLQHPISNHQHLVLCHRHPPAPHINPRAQVSTPTNTRLDPPTPHIDPSAPIPPTSTAFSTHRQPVSTTITYFWVSSTPSSHRHPFLFGPLGPI